MLMAFTAAFVLATLAVPFEDGQLRPYVQQLCQEAAKVLPDDVHSSAALQSLAVCFFAYSDMVYAGQPMRSCDAVIAQLRPEDPKTAAEMCEAAAALTRNWANGRY
ncbi:hypothetical protein LJR234_003576 [Mesorhizobium amorphae]|uniref:hypothetical protein n=1 Tax=Mesorhizobium amorphae TaxID=71433 RepID=UPI003ED0A85D